MKKIISVIGARPQFIKHAPIQLELQKHYHTITIHTGQHYDSNMSNIFFDELNISKPDYLFNLGNAKLQGEQTGLMIKEIESVLLKEKPDGILLYGDTNSTLAGALVACKENIPIIHIEAGLRSFNRQMPEEVNRIITDVFSYLLFCPTQQALNNLKNEGIAHDRIFLTGDVMCDMVNLVKNRLKNTIVQPYYFATIHRPYNTDNQERLKNILNVLNKLDEKVILSIHPRTMARMDSYNLLKSDYKNIDFIPPIGYTESISYQNFSSCIITDSGGIQKEAYILKKNCITIRSETEWIETLNGGWNTLVYEHLNDIKKIAVQKPIESEYKNQLYGNGNASQEIVDIIRKFI